jgi:phosphatidylserine decarboxylase
MLRVGALLDDPFDRVCGEGVRAGRQLLFGDSRRRLRSSGPNESQGYITEVATRALIFIEADNPDIGPMCIMPVGMAEVSTCQIIVYEGQHVKKGDQLGMFHFGGSTHCLIFRPGVKLEFDMHGQTPGGNSSNIPVNARIATVKR